MQVINATYSYSINNLNGLIELEQVLWWYVVIGLLHHTTIIVFKNINVLYITLYPKHACISFHQFYIVMVILLINVRKLLLYTLYSYQACMHRHEYIPVIHSVYFNKQIMYRSIIKLWTKVCTDLNCTYECVWVTYQEGNRWLRSRCTMRNVGLTKNTLIKNTHALTFISLKFEWMTLFCVFFISTSMS